MDKKKEKRLVKLDTEEGKRLDRLHSMYKTFGPTLPGDKVGEFCTKSGRQCDFLVHDLDGQARCAKQQVFSKPAVGIIIQNNRIKRNIKDGDGDYCKGHGA